MEKPRKRAATAGSARNATRAATPKATRATTARKAATSRKAAAPARTPDHEAIAVRAHALFVESGCQPGRDEEFWLEAERQLLAELNA